MRSVTPPETPTAGATWENPLIPNKRLRELYVAMVELRLLESHLYRNKKAIGEEAIRVSTALSLLPGDLTSEPVLNPATSFLRGAKLAGLNAASRQLAAIKSPAARLHVAIGAALACASKNSPIVVAYVGSGELTLVEWRPILRLAAAHAAPVLFVTLPAKVKNPGQLSLVASKCGVPGIPVDAADVVALYRVAQESLHRVRSGGGPVLMECIPFQLPGRKSVVADPIADMRGSILRRKLVTESWVHAVSDRFSTRLRAAAL